MSCSRTLVMEESAKNMIIYSQMLGRLEKMQGKKLIHIARSPALRKKRSKVALSQKGLKRLSFVEGAVVGTVSKLF